MSIVDRILGNPDLIEAALPSQGRVIDGLTETLDQERAQSAFVTEQLSRLEESLADAQIALEDVGWRRLAGASQTEFTIDGIKRGSELCRIMAVVNPLIKRAVDLRIAYIWGQGVSVTAKANGDEDGEQDVNAVVQGFLDDKGNQRVLTGAAAHEVRERACATDGSQFFAMYTDPRTGRVQTRSIPLVEIQDIITNPDDRDDPWYYKRSTISTQLIVASGQETFTTQKQTTIYHPAVTYQPKSRPTSIDGHQVRWDAPVVAMMVNRLDGWRFGIGDVYAGLPWARSYKDFLEDWSRLVKALSRFAWRATAKGRNQQQVRNTLAAAPTTDPITGAPQRSGATLIAPDGQGLEAIPKSGATIDSDSGRPLAAMVAAAMGVPVTMLLGDPGVTGARATAETLDQPTQLGMQARQSLWVDFFRDVADYVIDQAIKAPEGPLKGKRVVDAITGQETWVLDAEGDRTVLVAFPDLDDTALNFKIQAIALADTTGKLPPLTILRLLADAFELDDVDELIDTMTDDQGNFKDPRASAGQAAVDAFNRGEDPAAIFGGPQQDAPTDQGAPSE